MRRVPFYIEYFSIQRVLLQKSRAYSMQWVLTLCNEYFHIQQLLLHTTSTNSMLRVPIHTTSSTYAYMYKGAIVIQLLLLHKMSNYSMQRVLTLYNEYLLYIMSTLWYNPLSYRYNDWLVILYFNTCALGTNFLRLNRLTRVAGRPAQASSHQTV